MSFDKVKLRAYYNGLAGISKVFDSENGNVEGGLVNEYETFLQQAETDLPGLLISFNKQDFIYTRYEDGDTFYRPQGIKVNIARNLGVLKSMLEEDNATPVIQTKSFDFVSDANLKKILERDYQEIQKNLISSNWKSAIILSGGSIEAILLDLLSIGSQKALASSKAPKKGLNEWDLNDLVEVAVEENFIGNEVAKLSHTVREYRNLIHPGVEIRKNLKVEPEEAKIAVEVLHILIRERS